MDLKELISVIVPIYNIENCVRKCIESIISQTYKKMQIILVDDGSTDDSGKICDKYALLDARIEVIHQKNGGLVCARKAGLALAKGEYIGFVDGDDYVDSDFYLYMMTDMLENDVDFVHSGYVYEKGHTREINNQFKGGIYDISGSQAEFIKTYALRTDSTSYMPHNVFTKLFKADLIKKCYVQVPDFQSRGEDMICTFLCILESRSIFLDTRAGYHYVKREDSITHNTTIENMIDYGGLFKCLLEIFKYHNKLEAVQKELDQYFKDFYINFFAFQLKMDNILLYEYSDINSLKGKRVALYCAGKVGQDYYVQLSKYRKIDIVAWADQHFEKYQFDYRNVIGIDALSGFNFDILLIAVLSEFLADEIKRELIGVGIPESKIIWKSPVKI